jgi:hypothetical protein
MTQTLYAHMNKRKTKKRKKESKEKQLLPHLQTKTFLIAFL